MAKTARPDVSRAAVLPLSKALRDGYDDFSPAQQRIARYVVDHLEEVSYASAEEIAGVADTSSSTVVRFAQLLGYGGFPELQDAARAERRARLAPVDSAEAQQLLLALDDDEYRRSIREALLAVEEVSRRNARDDVARAGTLLTEAEEVIIASESVTDLAALHLAHGLRMLGRPARLATPGADGLVTLRDLRARAACVVFSPAGGGDFTRRVARVAGQRGAKLVAVADTSLADVAKGSAVLLLTGTSGILGGSLGAIVLAEALLALVAAADPATAEARLAELRRLAALRLAR